MAEIVSLEALITSLQYCYILLTDSLYSTKTLIISIRYLSKILLEKRLYLARLKPVSTPQLRLIPSQFLILRYLSLALLKV